MESDVPELYWHRGCEAAARGNRTPAPAGQPRSGLDRQCGRSLAGRSGHDATSTSCFGKRPATSASSRRWRANCKKANGPRDRAVLEILEIALEESGQSKEEARRGRKRKWTRSSRDDPPLAGAACRTTDHVPA